MPDQRPQRTSGRTLTCLIEKTILLGEAKLDLDGNFI
jgi:hypothetical protein